MGVFVVMAISSIKNVILSSLLYTFNLHVFNIRSYPSIHSLISAVEYMNHMYSFQHGWLHNSVDKASHQERDDLVFDI